MQHLAPAVKNEVIPVPPWREESTFARAQAREADLVIPAKAGIHSANFLKCAVYGLDSRFRGNDLRTERDPFQIAPLPGLHVS
jgi:hypothetical protein